MIWAHLFSQDDDVLNVIEGGRSKTIKIKDFK